LRLVCQAALNRPGYCWGLLLSWTLVYICYFSGDRRPLDVPILRIWGLETTAVVESVEPLNARVGGERLARVRYAFVYGGQIRLGTAYDKASRWQKGDHGVAIFAPFDPGISRLRSPRQKGSGIFERSLWLFPFAALVLGAPAWRRGLMEALLLREGLAADAHILEARRMRRRFGRPSYKFTYEFETLWGQVLRASLVLPEDLPARASSGLLFSTSAIPREGAPRRSVLYLPRDPTFSCLVDALPLRFGLRVDSKGQWVAAPSWRPLVRFGVLALSLGLGVASLAAWLLGYLPDMGR